MKTSLFFDPNAEHSFITELKQAQVEYAARYPHSVIGHFTYLGESWSVTTNGFRLTVTRSIRQLPLAVREAPIHLIELEDMIEDLDGTKRLLEGIYEEGEVRAEVDSFVYSPENEPTRFHYTIKIEGDELGPINDLYTKIRQHQTTPTHVWDVVAPNG